MLQFRKILVVVSFFLLVGGVAFAALRYVSIEVENGTLQNGAVVVSDGGASSGSAVKFPGVTTTPMATNLAWPWPDLSEGHWAVDVMKVAGRWESMDSLNLDADGWPLTIEGTTARTNILQKAAADPGRYVVLYEGSGTLSFTGGASQVSSSAGRIIIDSSGSIRMVITATDPANPIRNIRIVREEEEADFHAGKQFRDDFLATLAPYSAIRFMNWHKTNGSSIASWSDQPGENYVNISIKGAPIELMVDLANASGNDPWFNVPHLADDNYITQMALLVRDRLDSNLTPYFEYSNEVSNTTFDQHDYARAQGLALGLDGDPYTASMKFVSRRTDEMLTIVGSVFGAREFVGVIHPSSKTAQGIAQAAIDHGSLLSNHASRLMVVWNFYFGFAANWAGSPACGWTADRLIDEAEQSWIPSVLDDWVDFKAITDARGVMLGGYEGGHHFRRNNSCQASSDALFATAINHPRMKDAYLQLLNGLHVIGVEKLAHYNHIRQLESNNTFGALDHVTQARSAAPRYDAMATFSESL